MLKSSNVWAWAFALTLVTSQAVSANPQKNSASNTSWQEQEAWNQFTDKEQSHSFKMSKTRHPSPVSTMIKPDSVLAPAMAPAAREDSDDTWTVPSYIVDPGRHVYTPPQTTIQPDYLGQGQALPNWPYFAPRYGGGFFAPYAYGASRMFNLRAQSRVFQNGPSKASGNYYSPSTVDPTASGSYYANTGPRVLPVIQAPKSGTSDYWGNQGNPFQDELLRIDRTPH